MAFKNLSPINTLIFLVFATIFLIVFVTNFDLNKYNYNRTYSTIPIHDSSTSGLPANLRHAFLQKRNNTSPRDKFSHITPRITVAQQEATSRTLEQGTHKHYEEESEDWWEVYRSYEYETTDNLGDLFRVEVEEDQAIHKQHAELYDLQKADVRTQDTASQKVFNAGIGFQQGQTNYDANSNAAAGTEQHQQDDLLDVKQYQRIHVFQYTAAGMMIDEYEEERLAEYQYQLEIDVFNQWEYSSEHENNQFDELALGFN